MAGDFAEATRAYYRWLGHYLTLEKDGLRKKLRKMGGEEKGDAAAFPFFRGTCYLWRDQFRAVDRAVREAPAVLSPGDVHLENFGTWRDSEGRLVWGVNDFDEAAKLPFTADLVRLATSLLLARRDDAHAHPVAPADAAAALVAGYREGLRAGRPYILEDRKLAMIRRAALRKDDPVAEWEEIRAEGKAGMPKDMQVVNLLLTSLPSGSREPEFRRVQKGVGSLGRERWVVIADWHGAPVAREAKATAPSAHHAGQDLASRIRDHRRTLAEARRAPDPGFLLTETWVLRRLSPEMRKIELHKMRPPKDAPPGTDPKAGPLALLRAMGGEIANIHAGTSGDPAAITAWLEEHDDEGSWLLAAAEAAEARVLKAFGQFRKDPGVVAELPRVAR